jgi:hypothetical protein
MVKARAVGRIGVLAVGLGMAAAVAPAGTASADSGAADPFNWLGGFDPLSAAVTTSPFDLDISVNGFQVLDLGTTAVATSATTPSPPTAPLPSPATPTSATPATISTSPAPAGSGAMPWQASILHTAGFPMRSVAVLTTPARSAETTPTPPMALTPSLVSMAASTPPAPSANTS